jgi:hypothetical protein
MESNGMYLGVEDSDKIVYGYNHDEFTSTSCDMRPPITSDISTYDWNCAPKYGYRKKRLSFRGHIFPKWHTF